MVTITLYAKQKKRHTHGNMYIIKGETDHQPRLDA